MNPESEGRHTDPSPAPSSRVALEVSLLASTESASGDAPIALLVVTDPDEREYVAEALRQRGDLLVIAVSNVSAALDAAARGAPRVLVVTHEARAVIRHLPAVPVILLSDESSAGSSPEGTRLAPIVVLRGAFGSARLLDVASLLLDGRRGD